MGSLHNDRKWIAGGVAAAIVIAAGGWLLAISPQQDAKADAQQQLLNIQTQNTVLQHRITELRNQNDHADALRGQLAAARAAVPAQHDLEGFTRQLTTLASKAGVTVTTVTPSSPAQISAPSPAAKPDASSGASDGSSGNTSSTDTPSGDAPSADASPDTSSAASKAPGPAGKLYSIAVTVVTTGPVAAQRAFLSALDTRGTRRSLLTSATLAPIDSGAQSDTHEGSDSETTGDDSTTPAANPADAPWTLTTQLEIFVAPVSPDDNKALAQQADDNG